MGGKVRGATLRAKKRAAQALEELQEQQAENAIQQSYTGLADEELFVLDDKGANVPHHERPAKKNLNPQKKKRRGLSEREKQQMEKWMEGKSADELKALAEKGKEKMKLASSAPAPYTQTTVRANTTVKFDLWGENQDKNQDDQTEDKKQRTAARELSPGIGAAFAGTAPSHTNTYKGRKVKTFPETKKSGAATVKGASEVAVAVDVADAGQSYHPDRAAHEAAIKKALDIELRRNAAIEYERTPLAQGMSEETKALLVGDSSSDEEDDEDEAEGEDTTNLADGTLPKRTEKLTKAQRNKKRRLKQQKAMLEKQKQSKKFLKSFGELPKYIKDIKKSERARQEQKEQLRQKKEASQRIAGKGVELAISEQDPIAGPTLPVALASELENPTLRQLKPKGCLVHDRVYSMADRKMNVGRTKDGDRTRKERKELPKEDANGNPDKGPLSTKGKRNTQWAGSDFVIMGYQRP